MDESGIPRVELTMHPASAWIRKGQAVTLSWKVQGAETVCLTSAPRGPEAWLPLDWRYLTRHGRVVAHEAQMRVVPTVAMTYTLVAIGPRGRRARRAIVDVMAEEPCRRAPRVWFLENWRRPVSRGGYGRYLACLAMVRPAVELTVRPRVVYDDQEATLSWSIRCADCAQLSDDFRYTALVEDLTWRSGTRATFVEGSGSEPLPCSLDFTGQTRVGAREGPGEYTWTVRADTTGGAAATATVSAAFLPHPAFEGCGAEPQADIEAALLQIYRALLDGCLRDDAGLDDAIAAFRDGHLDRLSFWERLKAELQNINLVTFRCTETTDEAWRGVHWEEFGNVIELDWSPSHDPDLLTGIFHELVHKAGFHGDLEAFYTPDFIEGQVQNLVAACF